MTRRRLLGWAVAWGALWAWLTLSAPRCGELNHVDRHTCPNGEVRPYCRESCSMCMAPGFPEPCPVALGTLVVRSCSRRRGHWWPRHW